MLATPKNMKECERCGIQAIAISTISGDCYSAGSGDYFWLADDQPLVDDFQEPMKLVVKSVQFLDVEEFFK
jgi:hypothetical protein